MSVFHGKQSKGAMRRHREAKKLAAEVRNALTPQSRRKATRRFEAGAA